MSDPRLDIGELRQRITLQSVVVAPIVLSPAGVPPQDAAEEWTSGATYWAAIEPQRVRRSSGVDTPKNALWSLVTMRNPGAATPITTANRFLLGARILVIDGVQRDQERDEFLLIEVTENPAA